VERLQGLLDRRPGVPPMDLVEVDVVGAESAERGVDLAQDRLARQPGAVGSPAHPAVHLGGQDDLLAGREVGQRPAHDLLAGAVGVDVGRIEEVDARLDGPLHEGSALLLGQAPTVVAPLGHAVAHAAEADNRDVQPRGTQLRELHPRTPSPRAVPTGLVDGWARRLCGTAGPVGAWSSHPTLTTEPHDRPSRPTLTTDPHDRPSRHGSPRPDAAGRRTPRRLRPRHP
jgi:hypothetical protein